MKVILKTDFPDKIFKDLCYLRVGKSNDYITSDYDKLNGIGTTRGIQYATIYTKEVAMLILKLIDADLQIENFKG